MANAKTTTTTEPTFDSLTEGLSVSAFLKRCGVITRKEDGLKRSKQEAHAALWVLAGRMKDRGDSLKAIRVAVEMGWTEKAGQGIQSARIIRRVIFLLRGWESCDAAIGDASRKVFLDTLRSFKTDTELKDHLGIAHSNGSKGSKASTEPTEPTESTEPTTPKARTKAEVMGDVLEALRKLETFKHDLTPQDRVEIHTALAKAGVTKAPETKRIGATIAA
jgi:hypothetical protein